MLARLTAAAVVGVDAVPVSVEVDVSPGLPGLTMVGLPDATVRESRDRVRTAIRNSGFPFPTGRVTVSLAPADLKKIGAAFDLPIALGILAASGGLPHRDGPPITIVGGLSLDGQVPPMHGLLPIAVAARRSETTSLMFPAANLAEAGIVPGAAALPRDVAVARHARHRLLEPDAGRRPLAAPAASDRPPTTWRTCAARRSRGARSRSPRPAATTCCSADRRARARPCWRAGCRGCCRRSPSTRR